MSEYGLDKTDHPHERIDDFGDEEGEGYLLTFTWNMDKDNKIYSVNWFIFEIQGRHEGKPILAKNGCLSFPARGNYAITDWREAGHEAEGFVKWDGCSQWETASLHLDGATKRHTFFAAVDKAHMICKEIMGSTWDESDEEP